MAKSSQSKHAARVDLHFTTSGVSALARAMSRGKRTDLSAVLEEAVLFLDAAELNVESGGEVVLRNADGTEVSALEASQEPPLPN